MVMIEATYSEIMVDMEGGIRVEVATTCSLSCLTYMKDGARPCWAWVLDHLDMSAE